ncbi:MAG: septal ring lytic transglycosylase RlpA family protein [Kofleriaceae bacterium]|nr:septal ring lytic transglycosylase RlpA family protein [Kofleriaceae bacterium]
MRSLLSPRAWLLAISLIAATACTPAKPATTPRAKATKPVKRTAAAPTGSAQEGLGTWYGGKHHGGPTASGERFDKNAMTAAHKTLPMNTRVRVINKRNGKSVVLRINDRGPYGKGRIIDVSEAAARRLDMIDAGVVPVRIEVLR